MSENINGEVWNYCPECGVDQFKIGINYPGNEERICISCGQSWFPDIDYTNEVKENLSYNQRLIDDKEILLDALETLVKRIEGLPVNHQAALKDARSVISKAKAYRC